MKTRHLFPGALAVLCAGALFAQPGGSYAITTIAGGFSNENGSASAARLLRTEKAVGDPAGNLYVAETEKNIVWRVSPSGLITAYAGTGDAGFSGDGGPATAAQLSAPVGMALDAQGNLYVADSANNRVRRITPTGIISTVSGSASPTQAPGPRGLALDGSGNLYITSSGAGRLLRLSPTGQLLSILDGMSSPGGIALDPTGNIVVADSGHHIILSVTPKGDYTVVAGSGTAGFGGDRGPATNPAARLSSPADVAVDHLGSIYIADTGNGRIRKVSRSGELYLINTIAGGGPLTAANGEFIGDPFLVAFSGPRGLWFDAGESLYIADSESGFGMVRKLDTGLIRTVVGGSRNRGDGGPATSASLYFPRNVALDPNGNLLVADTGNNKVRRIALDGTINAVAGNGLSGVTGDGGPARTARLSSPVALAADASGNVYVGDTGNARFRQVRPAGDIITLVGQFGAGNAGDGAGASSAQVREIHAVDLDASGNIYLADSGNNRIRKITLDGVINRIAGTFSAGAGPDGVDALQSAINTPRGIAVDMDGTVYFSDTGNHRIRRILPDGTIETVAGTGAAGFAGDNGPAKSARFNEPTGLALDADGNLFVADAGNHRIRHITPGGLIRTIAGMGVAGFAGDGGPAAAAKLWFPTGVAVDTRGVLYVADRNNHRIRRLAPDISSGRLAITAGNNQSGAAGAKLPVPLTVRLTSSGGTPVSGVTVSFTVSRGTAQLSARSAVTNADGVASVTVTLGSTAGDVSVVASVVGLLPVEFQLTIQGAVVTGKPRISPGGIVGAGGSIPVIRQLAPNGLYTIYGENFAQPGARWQVGPGDLEGGQLPLRFQGVCVDVGGSLAPVLYIDPKQINFQAPRLNATGMQPVLVILNCRGTGEVKSDPEYVEYRAASPEFFFLALNADGRNPVAAVNALTYAVIGASGAKPGDILTVFGTGFGATNPLFFTGEAPDRGAQVTAGASVTLAGRLLADSEVLYVGVTPGYAGLYQVNFRVPDDAADGNLPLTLTIGGVPTPAGAYLTVRR